MSPGRGEERSVIVVKVELWPNGDEAHAEELGRLFVVNNGRGDAEMGYYDVKAERDGPVATRLYCYRGKNWFWRLAQYALGAYTDTIAHTLDVTEQP